MELQVSASPNSLLQSHTQEQFTPLRISPLCIMGRLIHVLRFSVPLTSAAPYGYPTEQQGSQSNVQTKAGGRVEAAEDRYMVPAYCAALYNH